MDQSSSSPSAAASTDLLRQESLGSRKEGDWKREEDGQRLKRLDDKRPQNILPACRGINNVPSPSRTPVSPQGSQEPCTPLSSTSHLDRWHEPQETLIVLDWDDTLFPTTYVWSDPRLHHSEVAPCFREGGDPALPAHPDRPWGRTMKELFAEHADCVVELLRCAAVLGHVVILTLAVDGWVQTSIRNFLPDMEGLLEELDIEVVYARNQTPVRCLRASSDEGHDIAKTLKCRAMVRVVKNFYGTGRGGQKARSWKNILSIGDSNAERLALQDITFSRKQVDRHGTAKECRCKVFKLLSEPSLEQLTAELQVVLEWLHILVAHDGDIDLDFTDLA